MTHDPLCNPYGVGERFTAFGPVCDDCDLIALAREDQTQRCITVVEEKNMYESSPETIKVGFDSAKREMLRSLRALLRNDSVPDPASVDIDAYIATLDATGLLELHRKIIIAREQGN